MVERRNERAEARGKEKPAEAGYGERFDQVASALKDGASIAPDGARAEDGAGLGARVGGDGGRAEARTTNGEAPAVRGGVREVDVFWRLQGDGLGYIATTKGGESIEQEAPGAWSAPNDDPMMFCEWLAAIYPGAVIHWLGRLDADDGCYGIPEVA